MNLKEYFEKTGMPKAQFCRITGISVPSLYQYLNNHHYPSDKLAKKMIAGTSGLLTYKELVPEKRHRLKRLPLTIDEIKYLTMVLLGREEISAAILLKKIDAFEAN